MFRASFSALLLLSLLYSCKPSEKSLAASKASNRTYVPVEQITFPPGHHWFGYYDKLQFDPGGRYVLGMQVDFEGRSPRPEDTIRIGLIDLDEGMRWNELGTSVAWSWQQGCMLQFIPGSASRVIWNDRQDGAFISHIRDIHSGEERMLPFPVYALSPDGQTALSVDFERINDLRPGYGYAGVKDPSADQLAPLHSGIYLCNLESGERELIISLARMQELAVLESSDPSLEDLFSRKNWVNHLLFNPDGSRFVFLHRWKSPSKLRQGGFATLMYSSDLLGEDIRLVDGSGYTSHFIWRDPHHLAMWTRYEDQDGFFLFKDDGSGKAEPIGPGFMTRNGHNSYLPGKEWILNDTYPDRQRMQQVYLYHVPGEKRVPLGDFYLPPEYRGEWRCDTHPRYSPDGTKVIIDCPVEGQGRQMILMDISSIVK